MSSAPCAACKFLRRKCTQECVFAPYFPPDQPQKFAVVHKVFGASNVTKILNELPTTQREDAVNSLAYEAETRLRDPVYGCVGLISILQHRLRQVQGDLETARKELATYIGPEAMLPILQPRAFMPEPPQHLGAPSSSSSVMLSMMGVPTGPARGGGGQLAIGEPSQRQQPDKHFGQMAAAALVARDEQEMLGTYQQPRVLGFNSGFDSEGLASTVGGFNQIGAAGGMSSSLSLSTIHNNTYQIQPQQQEPPHPHHHHRHQLQAQLLLQSLEEQPSAKGQEGRSGGPSC